MNLTHATALTRTMRIELAAVLAVVLALLAFSRIGQHTESSPAVEKQTAVATEESGGNATANGSVESSGGGPVGSGAGRPAAGASRGRQGSSTAKGSQSTESLPEGTIPQGFEIAFTRHGADGGVRPSSAVSLYLMNTEGSDLRMLAFGAEPGWSRDGKFIAFSDAAGSGGNSPSEVGEIRILNTEGSGVERLGFWGFSPTWSPDGGQLAFGWACPTQSAKCEEELWWGGSDPNEECGPECGIGVVARNGSGRRHLGTGIWPDWGPDGRIMFADGAPNAPCYYDQGTGWTRSSGLPWCELPIGL